jgi:hypothetical protein
MLLPSQYLPDLVRETARSLREEGFTTTCPAAQADGQQIVVLCGVEREAILVSKNPLAVKMWCAGDHTECPSWRAAHDHDPVVERSQKAKVDAHLAAIRRRHEASGLRYPDRDPDAAARRATVRRAQTSPTIIQDVIEDGTTE